MATDDFSPRPMAPALNTTDVPFEQQASKDDKRTANLTLNKDWSRLTELFAEEMTPLEQAVDENLIATEFKIESLARRKAHGVITRVLQRIEDAVSAVESAEREPGGN